MENWEGALTFELPITRRLSPSSSVSVLDGRCFWVAALNCKIHVAYHASKINDSI